MRGKRKGNKRERASTVKRKLKIATTGCNNVTMTIKVTKSCLSNRKADQATLARVKQTNKKKENHLRKVGRECP